MYIKSSYNYYFFFFKRRRRNNNNNHLQIEWCVFDEYWSGNIWIWGNGVKLNTRKPMPLLHTLVSHMNYGFFQKVKRIESELLLLFFYTFFSTFLFSCILFLLDFYFKSLHMFLFIYIKLLNFEFFSFISNWIIISLKLIKYRSSFFLYSFLPITASIW